MMNPEFLDLKKVIASYINKCPTPSKKFNHDALQRMHDLKPDLDDQKKKKEYYKLRSDLILSNGGFGMKYVMKYYRSLNEDVPITELYQEAMIGLLEAVDTFDIDKNTAFTTYAYFHIRKRLIDFIKHNKLVRAPRDIARNMKHVTEAKDTLYADLTREPTIEEIQKYLRKHRRINIKTDIITSILQLLDLNSCTCEDAFISEYNDQLSNEEDEGLFRKMEINILKDLDSIDPDLSKAAKLRFGIGRDYPHTPEEIRLLLNKPRDIFDLP